MSDFSCPLVLIEDVIDHPNADRLTIVKVLGYECISNKLDDGSWRYKPGDAAIYIPADAVLPDDLLQKMGFWKDGKGTLSGSKGNRVKPMRLRGIFSEGLLYALPPQNGVSIAECEDGSYDRLFTIFASEDYPVYGFIGNDCTKHLNITKYEVAVPVHMAGQVFNTDKLAKFPGVIKSFDLEPFEKNKSVFQTGDMVCVTEKLHGSQLGMCIIPGFGAEDALTTPKGEKNILVWSKGLGKQGLAFKDVPENSGNLYLRAIKEALNDKFWDHYYSEGYDTKPVYFIGEAVGTGVQDLTYGLAKPEFYVFNAFTLDEDGRPVPMVANEFFGFGLNFVPRVYTGPYDEGVIKLLRDGDSFMETFPGKKHMREGVVICNLTEDGLMPNPSKKLKMVSENYKLRKNATEYQ